MGSGGFATGGGVIGADDAIREPAAWVLPQAHAPPTHGRCAPGLVAGVAVEHRVLDLEWLRRRAGLGT